LLLPARFALRAQFPHLLLLSRGQKRENLALHPSVRDGQIGLRLNQRLGRRADQPFVYRHCLHGRPLRLQGGTKVISGGAILFAVLLHQVADLLLLRLGEVQLAHRQPRPSTQALRDPRSTRTTPAAESRALRECDTAGEQRGEQRCDCERTETSHGPPLYFRVQIADCRLQIADLFSIVRSASPFSVRTS
jgi:hypothetical protein